jgi:predicted NUDIX family phosphoesterase
VVPTTALPLLEAFVPYPKAKSIVDMMSASHRWARRATAERSDRLIQPIPCTVLFDANGRYSLFRRVQGERSDLSRHVTLIVGGHIDYPVNETPFGELVEQTLLRELNEEVGLDGFDPPEFLGVVTDRTTAAGARHVGLVHRVKVAVGRLKPRADEEFALRSKYSGIFLDATSLARMYPQFDAWSALVFEWVVSPQLRQSTHLRRQLALPLAIESDDHAKSADAGAARRSAAGRITRRRKGAA